MIHRDFTLGLLLLAGLRRIVLEKLGHGFLQNSVVLIRVFLKVNGFGAISAPDQLLSCRIVQVYEQRSDRNSGCLASDCTAAESAPTAAPSPRAAAVTKCRQVDAFFLPDNGAISDLEIRATVDPGQVFLRELFVDCTLNGLIDQLVR